MKIRIKGNSIRLRLMVSEVRAMGELKKVSEKTEFADRAFVYELSPSENEDFQAYFVGDVLGVKVPPAVLREWATGDKVGINAEINGLKILIEKDFKCLTERRPEEEGDTFANPNETHAC